MHFVRWYDEWCPSRNRCAQCLASIDYVLIRQMPVRLRVLMFVPVEHLNLKQPSGIIDAQPNLVSMNYGKALCAFSACLYRSIPFHWKWCHRSARCHASIRHRTHLDLVLPKGRWSLYFHRQ